MNSLFEITPAPEIGTYDPNLATQRESARQARDAAIERADAPDDHLREIESYGDEKG